MISKLLSRAVQLPNKFLIKEVLVARKLIPSSTIAPCRKYSDILPPSQYDIPFPKKLNIMYAMKVYWETIPLFLVTLTSFGILAFAIAWACNNKVDIVFSTHNRKCISRTMDLRNPSVHKIVIINQRYEPWPEMQDVLDKMVIAEKKALVRMQSCAQA